MSSKLTVLFNEQCLFQKKGKKKVQKIKKPNKKSNLVLSVTV